MKRLKHLICRRRGHQWAKVCVLCEQVRYHGAHGTIARCTWSSPSVARAHTPTPEAAS